MINGAKTSKYFKTISNSEKQAGIDMNDKKQALFDLQELLVIMGALLFLAAGVLITLNI